MHFFSQRLGWGEKGSAEGDLLRVVRREEESQRGRGGDEGGDEQEGFSEDHVSWRVMVVC